MTHSSFSAPPKNLEELLRRMTDRIRQSIELPEILEATVDEMRRFLRTDRVKIYQFHEDGSGEVVAEAIYKERLPSLLGHRFPAEDIPETARRLFLEVRQRSIVNVNKQEIGLSPLSPVATKRRKVSTLAYRKVDPCHVEYLTAMGVKASLVVPILHRHRLWGLLVAHHRVPKQFGRKELEIVQMIANQVTVAISHANLLHLTRLQGRRESIINQIVSRLHSTVQNPLRQALAQTVAATDCSGGRLFIPTRYPPGSVQIVTVGKQPVLQSRNLETSEPADETENASSATTPLESAFDWRRWLKAETTNEIVANLWAISDIEHSQMSSEMKAALSRAHIRGMLVVKLIHRHRFLGYLSLFRQAVDVETVWAGRLDSTDVRQSRPRQSFETWRELKKDQAHAWSPGEIGLIQDLSDRFASVIYQTQLYQKVQALNTDLEQRVMQRTAELEKINRHLKEENIRREKALQALQEARDSLTRLSHQNKLILNAAGEGIYGIDPKGKIVFANPAAGKLLGYANGLLVEQFMHDVLKPANAEGALYDWKQSPIFTTLKYGRTHHVVGDLFQREDGTNFPVEYVCTSIQEKGNIIGAVVIFQDITERQAVEQMKDEFIAVVSHELRTPLTSIRAALGLLAQNSFSISDAKRQRMVEIAFSNTNRLVRLVSDILDVERIKLGKITLNKQPCDWSAILAQSIDEMRAMADKHRIRLAGTSPYIQLYADPDRLIQALTNLLSNAIKFSPAGSTVSVTVSQLHKHERAAPDTAFSARGLAAIEAGFAVSDALLLVQVKDEGKGIPEDKLETIFAQFEQLYTSDADHQGGTGLGLAICRSIIQQHQGEIWAQRRAERGSTFFFTLPTLLSKDAKKEEQTE
ncbi:MAG: ATP-binding protein [Cyanobacteria bacterium J06606_4]